MGSSHWRGVNVYIRVRTLLPKCLLTGVGGFSIKKVCGLVVMDGEGGAQVVDVGGGCGWHGGGERWWWWWWWVVV